MDDETMQRIANIETSVAQLAEMTARMMAEVVALSESTKKMMAITSSLIRPSMNGQKSE
jgi:hypothetical protein